MTINEILESGLLELYVSGAISDSDRQIVETALNKYPSLKTELKEIEDTFLKYAELHSVTAPKNLIKNLNLTDHSSIFGSQKIRNKLIVGFASLLIFALGSTLFYQHLKHREAFESLTKQLDDCKITQSIYDGQIAIYNDLNHQDHKIIQISSSETYPSSDIYFHTNSTTNKNYLQIKSIPNLNNHQRFQLWALVEDLDPIPLNVFEMKDHLIFAVDFVESTKAYAITIEALGGAQKPSMEQLIGVFNLEEI